MFSSLGTVQKLLVAAAAAALVVVGLAFVPSPRSLLTLFERPEVPVIKEPPAVKLAPPLPLAQYDAIAARPLFNLDRKPDPVPPPKPTGAAAALGDLSQYRLTGIVRASGIDLALVQKTGGQALTLKKGDTFEGWIVDAVEAKGITISGGDRTEILAIPKAENRAQSP